MDLLPVHRLHFDSAPPASRTTRDAQPYPPAPRRHTADGSSRLLNSSQLLVRKQAASSRSPLANALTFDVPVELLRQIFAYTSPVDRHDVVVFMSVCSAWRYVALGITALFTSADWDNWPVEFLREWCGRAGHAELEVMLTPEGVRRALVDDEYARLLDETSDRWHDLFMEFDRTEEDSIMSQVHTLLSRWKCPRLRTLALSDLDGEGQNEIFALSADFAPDLEELMCKDTHIIRAVPWEKLKRVLFNVDFWMRGKQADEVFRTISYTDSLVFDGCSFSGIGDRDLVLEGVRELTIEDDSIAGFAEWPLRRLSFPHATSLVLCGMRPFASEFSDQDKVYWNNAFPAITSLTLRLPHPWYHLILPLLSRDAANGDTVWFPALTTLTLGALRAEGRHCPTVPEHIEGALVEFLGTQSRRRHQNTSLMRNVYIRGLAITERFRRQLKSLVQNVEIQTDDEKPA